MDRELPENEAANVQRHVRACSDCRGRIDAYEQVSRGFVAYCDAAIGKSHVADLPRWVPALLASAAAAAVLPWYAAKHRQRDAGPLARQTRTPAVAWN